MYSLDNAFNELLDKIRDPDALNPAKSAPVFYFRYPPEMMLTVKKHLPRLISRITGMSSGIPLIISCNARRPAGPNCSKKALLGL